MARAGALALILACLAAEAALLTVGIDDLDEGYFVQQATRVLHGQVPYRDFHTLYSPGLAYLHALVFATLGGPSLVATRVVALLGRAGLAIVLYAMARPLVRQPLWAALPGVFLLIGLDDAPERWEPHPGWLSTMFAVLAAWTLSARPSTRSFAMAGSLAAAAYVFKQNTGVFILAAVVLTMFLCRSSPITDRLGWRAAAWQPVAAMAGFAAVTATWLVPLLVALQGDLSRLGVLVGAVDQASLFYAPEITSLIPLACIAAGLSLWRDTRLRWYLIAGIALLGTQYPRMDTLHLAWSAPLLLVVGAAALDRLGPLFAVPALLGLALLAAPMVAARLDYVGQPRASIGGVEAPERTADELHAVVADIQQRTEPGQSIFVYPTSPLLYVLADRPNPTRFDHLNPGAASAADIDALIDDIRRSDVQLIVTSDFWRNAWGPSPANAPLEAHIAQSFEEVARHGSYRVHAPRL
jgi:hypothetical protein